MSLLRDIHGPLCLGEFPMNSPWMMLCIYIHIFIFKCRFRSILYILYILYIIYYIYRYMCMKEIVCRYYCPWIWVCHWMHPVGNAGQREPPWRQHIACEILWWSLIYRIYRDLDCFALFGIQSNFKWSPKHCCRVGGSIRSISTEAPLLRNVFAAKFAHSNSSDFRKSAAWARARQMSGGLG